MLYWSTETWHDFLSNKVTILYKQTLPSSCLVKENSRIDHPLFVTGSTKTPMTADLIFHYEQNLDNFDVLELLGLWHLVLRWLQHSCNLKLIHLLIHYCIAYVHCCARHVRWGYFSKHCNLNRDNVNKK